MLCPAVNKSKAQLMHELNIERQKNEMLIKRLRETNKIVKSYELSQTPGKSSHRHRQEQQNKISLSLHFSQQQEGAN